MRALVGLSARLTFGWVALLLMLGAGCGGSSRSVGIDGSMNTVEALGSAGGGSPGNDSAARSDGSVRVDSPSSEAVAGDLRIEDVVTVDAQQPDMPLSAGGFDSGASGTGAVNDGGPVESGGVSGNGGTSGPDGASGSGGVSGGTQWYGMTCSAAQDCPANTICCDGSNESCDGTRLPSGDGTNPGEFVVSSDGSTVTDSITGLVWQADGSGTRTGCSGGAGGVGSGDLTCTLAEAKAYCAGLTLGGISGWRLPALMELSTIVEFASNSPAIDQTAFPNTPSEWFWTSSPLAGSSTDAWTVVFGGGIVYSDEAFDNFRVRCVQGSRCYPTSRFVALTGGVVQDTLTGLIWQQDGSGTRTGCSGVDNLLCTWAEAQAYCANVGSGFRLPTIKELMSIVDFTVTSGATINQTAFPNAPAEQFWTSTPCADVSSCAWYVVFGNGDNWTSDVSSAYRVRCVR